MMNERTNYPNASTGTVIIIDLESTCLRSAFVLYASNIQLLPYCKKAICDDDDDDDDDDDILSASTGAACLIEKEGLAVS